MDHKQLIFDTYYEPFANSYKKIKTNDVQIALAHVFAICKSSTEDSLPTNAGNVIGRNFARLILGGIGGIPNITYENNIAEAKGIKYIIETGEQYGIAVPDALRKYITTTPQNAGVRNSLIGHSINTLSDQELGQILQKAYESLGGMIHHYKTTSRTKLSLLGNPCELEDRKKIFIYQTSNGITDETNNIRIAIRNAYQQRPQGTTSDDDLKRFDVFFDDENQNPRETDDFINQLFPLSLRRKLLLRALEDETNMQSTANTSAQHAGKVTNQYQPDRNGVNPNPNPNLNQNTGNQPPYDQITQLQTDGTWITRDLTNTGIANNEFHGNYCGDVMNRGIGHLIIHGNVRGNVTNTGVGNLIIHGNVIGNVKNTGVGNLIIHGNVIGNVTNTGTGDVRIKTYPKENSGKTIRSTGIGRVIIEHNHTKTTSINFYTHKDKLDKTGGRTSSVDQTRGNYFNGDVGNTENNDSAISIRNGEIFLGGTNIAAIISSWNDKIISSTSQYYQEKNAAERMQGTIENYYNNEKIDICTHLPKSHETIKSITIVDAENIKFIITRYKNGEKILLKPDDETIITGNLNSDGNIRVGATTLHYIRHIDKANFE